MTQLDLATLALRVTAGAIFVAQGYRKLFVDPAASHGRANLETMIRNRGMPMPGRLALLVSAVEFVGGVALLLGVFTRVATVPLAGILVVAIAGFKFRTGFLGGWDWPLSVLTLLVAIALLGPGAISLDAALTRP
jgi:putative oxidoreductase